MDQYNENGTNIAEVLGDTNITYNIGTKEDDWLRRYDPLEDNEKKYTDKQRVGKIENTLNSERVCLIKASEGRGKTFLSRIIAHDYFEKGYEVWFGNITKLNASGESLKQWCKKENTNCLVIFENLHACKNNDDLECWISSINTMRKPLWYNNGNNKLLFLLNARPTSEDFDTIMSDLGDNVTEELEPDIEYCKGVASLSSRPIDEKALDNFLKNKRFGFDKGNANLRLLRIVIEIWETDTDNSLSSIQDVNEKKIILKFKTKYSLDLLGETEKGYLLFLSSIFQFDIPLSRELLKPEEIDFLIRLCNEKHLVIDKDYKFYLPHSVDALYLSKAIGGRQYEKQTQDKVLDFVDRILNYEIPRDFEGDFILLIQGLIQRKEEFQILIDKLADWPMAERIIKNINPGFIIIAFNPQNGHSFQEILDYYKANLDWLKTLIFEITPVGLNHLCYNFKRYLKHNIFKDFIKNPIDLDDYLRNNENVFYQNHILEAICDLGEEYKQTLKDYYKDNIDDRLRPSFLRLSPTQLVFVYRFFKIHLEHNIIKDIIKAPQDLNDYLRNNDKIYCQVEILEAIIDLGKEYKRGLIDYYEYNIDRLKMAFFELSSTRLVFVYKAFKKHLKHNILEDLFEDSKDLDDYLKANYKVFLDSDLLSAIGDLEGENKQILLNNYKQNTDKLKLSFLELSPIKLSHIYLFFNGRLNHNIIEDIFKKTPPKDLDDYLKANCNRLNDTIIRAIGDLGDEYKLVLEKYKVNRHGYDFFFSTSKNGYCVSGNRIDFIKDSNTPFDVTCIENNCFYLYRIDWYDMQRFVKIIQKNMNDDNRQRSIEMVEAIIQIVLDKIYSLFLAKARDLFYFYANIASVDKNLFENLINEKFVIIDIKYRISRKKYSLDDLRLFSLFYNEEWFYRDMVKIVNKSLDSLNEADEKDLSMLLGNLKYNNDDFYKDLITNEIVVGNAKKRLKTFTLGYDNLLDNLYLFGHFYSQDWCKDEMNLLINNADKKQQKVIKEWHDKVMEGLIEGGKTLDIGTLWDYIHNKFFNGQQNN